MNQTNCPICNEMMNSYYERYPNMVCCKCSGKTITDKGIKIEFYNIDISGGFYSLVNNIKGDIHECYIDKLKCYADEARFGGIVVQLSQ